MDRRLIDLEMKGFEDELGRRRQSLDTLKAGRMDYWLDGWKQSYAVAFEEGEANPNLSAKQCRERLDDLGAFVADRVANEDVGTAEIFSNWHDAFAHCVSEADPSNSVDAADPAEAPSPEELGKMPWLARRSLVGRLTGKAPRNAKEAEAAYDAWFHDRPTEASPA